MKPYRFQSGNRHGWIDDEEFTFSPSLRDGLTLRKQRWPKADIIAVSVQPAARKTRACEVSVTHKDGTVRRFPGVPRTAAEVESAFTVRGYRTDPAPQG